MVKHHHPSLFKRVESRLVEESDGVLLLILLIIFKMQNENYDVRETKTSTKIVNIIAPIILAFFFVFGVGYTSYALMGNRNANYLEKVKQKKEATEKQATVQQVTENVKK